MNKINKVDFKWKKGDSDLIGIEKEVIGYIRNEELISTSLSAIQRLIYTYGLKQFYNERIDREEQRA